MAGLIVPHFAVGSGDEITIDGVVYKVPRIDANGRLYVNPYPIGASEVQAVLKATVDPSTTRVTVITPTSGKKVRIVSVLVVSNSATSTAISVYFGTGATISTNPGNEITNPRMLNTVHPNLFLAWPDGGGPVGAVDAVVSLATSNNILTSGVVIIHYREE